MQSIWLGNAGIRGITAPAPWPCCTCRRRDPCRVEAQRALAWNLVWWQKKNVREFLFQPVPIGFLMLPYRILLSFLVLFSVYAGPSFAQEGCAPDMYGKVSCAPPGGVCARDLYGQVTCAKTAGGGAEVDSYGHVKTGPGQCITDSDGKVMCSSQVGGNAALDSNGKAVCSGGCVPGR